MAMKNIKHYLRIFFAILFFGCAIISVRAMPGEELYPATPYAASNIMNQTSAAAIVSGLGLTNFNGGGIPTLNGFGTNTTFNQVTFTGNLAVQSALDPDVALFLTNAAMTNFTTYATNIQALNNMVISLKAAGVWTNFAAIYPFAAGNTNGDGINLIAGGPSPITWSGFLTNAASHTQLGISNNGAALSIGIAPTSGLIGTPSGLTVNGLFAYVVSGLTTTSSQITASIGSQNHGVLTLAASSTNTSGNLNVFSASGGANTFPSPNGSGNVFLGTYYSTTATNVLTTVANNTSSALTGVAQWTDSSTFTLGISGQYQSNGGGITPANSGVVIGFVAVTRAGGGVTNLTPSMVTNIETIVQTYEQNMKGIFANGGSTNSIVLAVDSIGALGISGGVDANGAVTDVSHTTSDEVSKGNVDAQSYTLNGVLINFNTATSGSLFCTNNTGNATNFNGVYFFDTPVGYWTNAKTAWAIVPQNNPNTDPSWNTFLTNFSVMMTNPASPAGNFYFTKSGSSLVGQWTPPPQSGFGGFAPSLVSVLTSSNNPYVGQFTGTFTGSGSGVSNVTVVATNVIGLPSITNFTEIVGAVPSAGTFAQFTGTTNTDGSVQITNATVSGGTGSALVMLLVMVTGNSNGGLNVTNGTTNVHRSDQHFSK